MNRFSLWLDRVGLKLDAAGEKLEQKKFNLPTEIVSGILFFAVGLAILLLLPSQVEVGTRDVIDGRAFPRLLMIVMMLMSAVLIIRELINVFVKKRPWTVKTVSLLTEVKALLIFLIFLGFYLIASLTNQFIFGAIFCALGFMIFFRCRKPLYYLITLAAAVIIWAAFKFGLNVNF